MSCSNRLTINWLAFKILRLHRNQGETLESAAAHKRMICPRCREQLVWSEESLVFYCSGKKCGYREVAAVFSDTKVLLIPPSGSRYWIETVNPPLWFMFAARFM